MSVIETIEFSTLPGTEIEALQAALTALDAELRGIGGFRSRDLFRVDGAEHAWLLDYRWDSLEEAQTSMAKVAGTPVFGALMALVDSPETMRMVYGTPA
ncbi:hypothetical protein [Leucobacter sp. M11]|uniref:hypothetical protein n=1 Tax=Leucobacter sp. M11 TaxID=2993565 RepID=UPI002D7EB865|nr:hypothetical protein [Leucobacter sp. M11]MEB4613654.1 hypothetical protein [Leucobacter sp. M11]